MPTGDFVARQEQTVETKSMTMLGNNARRDVPSTTLLLFKLTYLACAQPSATRQDVRRVTGDLGEWLPVAC